MISKFLSNVNFHQLMKKIDHDLAEKRRLEGCSCGGCLHRSDYPRKPLGLHEAFSQYYEKRESFCCDQDGCRKRVTPPSVRFFGRTRFVGSVLLLISALVYGATEKRCKKIEALFGIKVSKETWERWSRWWRDIFITTRFWKEKVGIISTANTKKHFPRCFFEIYRGSFQEQFILILQFLAPLTAGANRAV